MVSITKDMVLVIHEDLINAGGEVHGILCEATIDYIIERIDCQSGVFAKASIALYMSRLHPFFDGNKRTCFVVAAIILRMNGYWLGKSEKAEIIDLLNMISDTRIECDIERIERWLKYKSQRWWGQSQKSLTNYL